MTADLSYYHDPDGRKWRARERRVTELMTDAGREGAALGRGYWELVHDLEEAPLTTDLEQLTTAGFVFPPARELDDEALDAKLTELIAELTRMGVRLFGADDVPSRALYDKLVTDVLEQEREDIPTAPGWTWTVDLMPHFEDPDGECPV